MMGPESNIHAALMHRVEMIPTLLPISYPGKKFDQTQSDYIRVTVLRNRPERWALAGGDPLDRMGFLVLDLFSRLGRHEVEYIAQAESIASHFPRDLRLTFSGGGLVILTAEARQGRKDPNGTHWMTPIEIEYQAES